MRKIYMEYNHNMSKTTGIILGVIVALFGGLLTWYIIHSQSNVVDYSQYDAAKIIPADKNNGEIAEHVSGKADSPVVLVEYGDLQCPGCATAMPRVSQLKEEYGDRVAFVFRHYLLQYHPNARAAATALESAGLQGYFWEMLDTLYANQAIWGEETGAMRTDAFANLFSGVAGDDADIDKFKADLNSENIEKKISFDNNLGIKLSQVSSTPAFYVNGKNIDITNAQTEDAFMNALRGALDEALVESK